MCTSLYGFTFLITCSIYGVTAGAYPPINFDKKGSHKDLVFPDSDESGETTDGLHPSLPSECLHKGFCENIEKYPSNLFRSILETANTKVRYGEYFREVNHTEPIGSRDQEKNISLLCPSTRGILYPKVAYNIRRKLRYIYNLPGYRQALSVEVCVEESTCKFYGKLRLAKTKCEQKFGHKLFLTADANGRPYVDIFKFPSACACKYRKENERVELFNPHKS